MKLNDALKASEVELRIGATLSKGFSLLLYKTSRTDVKRLDEVYPMLWKNRYFYDTKNLLCCEISVYNKDLKEWITRVDVGIESFAEKEKGSYSDAFKRAGFKFGIGSELYNSPFIWINWEMEQKNNKNKPKKFYGSNLEISKYTSDGEKVTDLEIKYSGEVIYSMSKPIKQTPPKVVQRPNYTELANNCKTIAELESWFKSLTGTQQKEASAVTKNRKKEIINGEVPF